MTIKGIQTLKMAALTALVGAALATAAHGQTIKTAVDATFAPHAMMKMGGGMEGFNIDLGNEIAKRMGRPIDIEGTQFSGLIPGLNAKKYDFILAPTTVTKERAETLLFTEGYLDTDYMFVQKKSEPAFKALEELKGKTITVNKGSAYEGWAKTNMDKYGFKYDVYDTNADAIQAVLSGRAYANMAGNTGAQWAAKQNPLLQTSYRVSTGLVWSIPFRKDDTEGRAKMSMVIKCMKMDGTIGKLHEKWFGEKAAPDSSAMKVVAGTGVPGMAGYDPTPVTPKCS
jgi:polar amino acid transport system substrate-binding protein